MNKYVERLYNGIIKENPTFVLMLGMCPTLAVTSSAVNGLGMGLSTTVVLICSNLLISLFRKVIPNGVRMPAYIVIVASLVTVVQFLMHRLQLPEQDIGHLCYLFPQDVAGSQEVGCYQRVGFRSSSHIRSFSAYILRLQRYG